MFILAVIIVTAGHAQVSTPNMEQNKKFGQSVFGLGVSAGFVSGFGLSFRHHLPKEFSYQVVFGIIKSGDKTLYNIGGEGQYDIIRAGETRFFVGGAAGYFYSGNGSNDLEGPFRLGAGLGGEWKGIESFHVSGELLFTYFNDGTILPLPQVSAHYYFF